MTQPALSHDASPDLLRATFAADDDPESLVAGLRAIAREPGPRIMVLAVGVYYVVVGAVDVLAVVIAVLGSIVFSIFLKVQMPIFGWTSL